MQNFHECRISSVFTFGVRCHFKNQDEEAMLACDEWCSLDKPANPLRAITFFHLPIVSAGALKDSVLCF